MNNIDYKLDTLLRCLNYYYSNYISTNDIYLVSGDKTFLRSPFVSEATISAFLDFSDEKVAFIQKTELSDLLERLKSENLITSKIIDNDVKFKILTDGIHLIEKGGYVNKQKR